MINPNNITDKSMLPIQTVALDYSVSAIDMWNKVANIFNTLSMVESALNNLTLQIRETYDNMFNMVSMLESALNGKRYWIDILGRPRRSPLARPLLHKGKKGKKHG